MDVKPDRIAVVVTGRTEEARDIIAIEFESADGGPLPSFDAGAHVDVHFPDGSVRQYSLLHASGCAGRYMIGVLRAQASRGGSRYVHDTLRVGDRMSIGMPRNLFRLSPDSRRAILFAGGIGITPILAMAESLVQRGVSFDLHYAARSEQRAAFRERIAATAVAASTRFYFDDASNPLSIAQVLESAPREADLYVCGPAGFMAAVFEHALAAGWPRERVHQENFSAPLPDSRLSAGAFEVRVASSGATYRIEADQSIAAVLLAHGVDVALSCEQGICGCCMTRVLEGQPDHRDYFMTDEEHTANTMITPCCSRSLSPLLVLDL